MFENVRELMFSIQSDGWPIKFYSDGTYKLTRKDTISFWKLEDDKFWYRHDEKHKWDWDGSDIEFETEFKKQYNLWLLGLIEKEVGLDGR